MARRPWATLAVVAFLSACLTLIIHSVFVSFCQPSPSDHAVVMELSALLAQQQAMINRTSAELAELKKHTSNSPSAPVANTAGRKPQPKDGDLLQLSPKCTGTNCKVGVAQNADPHFDALSARLQGLKITYETCAQSLANVSITKTLEHPHWLHFPKAGIGFGAVLYGYLCTSALGAASAKECDYCGRTQAWDSRVLSNVPAPLLSYCDTRVKPSGYLQNHIPWPKIADPTEGIVGLFRDPRKRLVAAYNENKHSFGLGEMDHSTAKEFRENFIKRVTTLKDFAKDPDIKSCQTKMMLGEYCAMSFQLDRSKLATALKRLRSMSFVGLAEAPDASACLFHHMFGGPLRRSDFQDSDLDMTVTPGRPLPGGGKSVPYDQWTSIQPEDDPYDWELYQEARAIFVRRLQEHRLL